jgi:hypothetical protein
MKKKIKNLFFKKISSNLKRKIFRRILSPAVLKLQNTSSGKRNLFTKDFSKRGYFRNLLFRNLILLNFIFPFVGLIKKFLISSIVKMFPTFPNIELYTLMQNKNILNLSTILDSIIKKTRSKKFRLKRIISFVFNLLKNLQTKIGFNGFKIQFSGRVSRRDRATYYWKKFGKLPLNTKLAKIDYYYKTLIMRNSICIMKIWIVY